MAPLEPPENQFIIEESEPTRHRCVYIDKVRNRVHVRLPIVGGDDIGTDNTCKSVKALQEFFGSQSDEGSALKELTDYAEALEFDIEALPESLHHVKEEKTARLTQVQEYILALQKIRKDITVMTPLSKQFPEYPDALKAILGNRNLSNLYSMQLRPQNLDIWLRSVNPVFTVDRVGPQQLYHTLIQSFASIPLHSWSDHVQERVLAKLQQNQQADFEAIRMALKAETQDSGVDFDTVNKAEIDALFPFSEEITTDEYIQMLLYKCAAEQGMDLSPFEKIQDNDAKAEKLSILTQFFLGHVNIHCHAKGLATTDFGQKLEASRPLSESLVETVCKALRTNPGKVEQEIVEFINRNSQELALAESLTMDDIKHLKQQLRIHWLTVEPHIEYDEFMILITAKPESQQIFTTYHGSIGTDLAIIAEMCFPELTTAHMKAASTEYYSLRDVWPIAKEAAEKKGFPVNEANFIAYLNHLTEAWREPEVLAAIERHRAVIDALPEASQRQIQKILDDAKIVDVPTLLQAMKEQPQVSLHEWVTTQLQRIKSILKNSEHLTALLEACNEAQQMAILQGLDDHSEQLIVNATGLYNILRVLKTEAQKNTLLAKIDVSSIIHGARDLQWVLSTLKTEALQDALLARIDVSSIIENIEGLSIVFNVLKTSTQQNTLLDKTNISTSYSDVSVFDIANLLASMKTKEQQNELLAKIDILTAVTYIEQLAKVLDSLKEEAQSKQVMHIMRPKLKSILIDRGVKGLSCTLDKFKSKDSRDKKVLFIKSVWPLLVHVIHDEQSLMRGKLRAADEELFKDTLREIALQKINQASYGTHRLTNLRLFIQNHPMTYLNIYATASEYDPNQHERRQIQFFKQIKHTVMGPSRIKEAAKEWLMAVLTGAKDFDNDSYETYKHALLASTRLGALLHGSDLSRLFDNLSRDAEPPSEPPVVHP